MFPHLFLQAMLSLTAPYRRRAGFPPAHVSNECVLHHDLSLQLRGMPPRHGLGAANQFSRLSALPSALVPQCRPARASVSCFEWCRPPLTAFHLYPTQESNKSSKGVYTVQP